MRYMLTLDLIDAVARAGSIRRAADLMNIAPSALNRRLAAFEEEFGTPVFERLPHGVRPNAAGELLLQHIRAQRADLARLRGTVDELKGLRRGHVAIACSQGLTPFYLPQRIADFRSRFPRVTFSLKVARPPRRGGRAHPLHRRPRPRVRARRHGGLPKILCTVAQPVCAVMAKAHPLAAAPRVRLRDCLDGPHVAPAAHLGVRHLLDLSLRRSSRALRPIVEADSFEFLRRYVTHEGAVGFEIPIGLSDAEEHGLVVRPARGRARRPPSPRPAPGADPSGSGLPLRRGGGGVHARASAAMTRAAGRCASRRQAQPRSPLPERRARSSSPRAIGMPERTSAAKFSSGTINRETGELRGAGVAHDVIVPRAHQEAVARADGHGATVAHRLPPPPRGRRRARGRRRGGGPASRHPARTPRGTR